MRPVGQTWLCLQAMPVARKAVGGRGAFIAGQGVQVGLFRRLQCA